MVSFRRSADCPDSLQVSSDIKQNAKCSFFVLQFEIAITVSPVELQNKKRKT